MHRKVAEQSGQQAPNLTFRLQPWRKSASGGLRERSLNGVNPPLAVSPGACRRQRSTGIQGIGAACTSRRPTALVSPEQLTQPTHPTQRSQLTHPAHALQPRHATQPRHARQPVQAIDSTVSMQSAMAALPAVAIERATAALPAVAIDPATPALPAVAIEPATPALPVVATEPATPALPTVTSEPATPTLSDVARERTTPGSSDSVTGFAPHSPFDGLACSPFNGCAQFRCSTVLPSFAVQRLWPVSPFNGGKACCPATRSGRTCGRPRALSSGSAHCR